MRVYRLYMRSFAPWPAFGGIFPGPAYVQSGRLTVVNDSNFDGDNRGFSTDTNNGRVTARINLYLDIIPEAKKVGALKTWCNQSGGPWMLIGPTGHKTAHPKATVANYPRGNSLHVEIGYAAANPLVPGAPDIDAAGAFDFTLANNAAGQELSIDTDVSGDQFPACETFIDDQSGHKVFLGGFAPESRSPAQLARLFGQLNRPGEIYFRSSVRILLDGAGLFTRLSGTFGTQLKPAFVNWPGSSMGLEQWNSLIMDSIPKPIDGWLY